MTTIPDAQLYSHAARVQGKVVVITGGANGIGREAALLFAKHGAKIVIGDRDVAGAAETASEITKAGGEACAVKCDVTVWEDQVAMFETAVANFGTVDIVIPNAGVNEIGNFHKVNFENGVPVKPRFPTLEINLTGLLYTSHLALHYLFIHFQPGDLKSIIMTASMASWQTISTGPTYCASKHAVLGFMRSLDGKYSREGVRLGSVHPFFVDTAIVPAALKVFLSGVPKCPVDRVAGAIFYAATDPNQESSGSAWMLLDNRSVVQVPKEEFKMGVYKMLDTRVNMLLKGVDGIALVRNTLADLLPLFIGKKVILSSLVVAAASLAWNFRAQYT